MTFVYPDMKTVIVGKFKDGILIEGKSAKIVAERCKHGIKELSISSTDQNSPNFNFKRNNHLRVHQPTIMDPFEKNNLFIKDTIGKGEGLFARQDFQNNEIVSYYSGLIVPSNEVKAWFKQKNITGYER